MIQRFICEGSDVYQQPIASFRQTASVTITEHWLPGLAGLLSLLFELFGQTAGNGLKRRCFVAQ
ncbi:hypothetical protein RESH_01951 [Rhodopirellula europaea SH398]|uniref:Uncharacterized protein n=1 Tax=Rhodopirellula europaea SH398 TaxID=1263868 RepID=M5SMR9_9BACT|nr:hypothetical protein RESH_01951 [Rhodopirellula europaea SH398]